MTPIQQVPQYAEAETELNSLGAALGKVNARIAEVEALLRNYAPNPEEEHVAAALEFADTGKVRAPESITVLHDEHIALRTQRDAVTSAIKKRSNAMIDMAGALSADLCRDQAAAHKKIAVRALAALRELQAAFDDERAFVRDIENAGYSAGYLREHVRWPLIDGDAIKTQIRDMTRYAG